MKLSIRGFVIIGLSILFLFLILRTAVTESKSTLPPAPQATHQKP